MNWQLYASEPSAFSRGALSDKQACGSHYIFVRELKRGMTVGHLCYMEKRYVNPDFRAMFIVE
jgi:hypothetical protein